MIETPPLSAVAAPIRAADGAVVRMEHHDRAYQIWRDAGVRDRILVHIDAHHDMWWFDDPAALTIANFVCAALKEDLVDEIFWVVPDATWRHSASRRAVLRHLQRLRATYPFADRAIDVGRAQMSTRLLKKRVTVCPLAALPPIHAPVLLDLDVDFFLIPFVSHGDNDSHASVPWLWPRDLLDQLDARGVRSDLVTIAYSVDGGYTPLDWKYLGDELAARLGATDASIEGFDEIRAGALAAARGDRATAARAFERAAAHLPESAAPDYHLARCYLAMGRADEARDAYRRAVACDPTYRTPYNNDGLNRYRERRYREAAREWHEALVLDAADAHAHLGLARVAGRRKQWRAAKDHATNALALDGDLVDAYRILGRALAVLRQHDGAIRAYETSLKLTRNGRRSIAATPSSSEDGRLVDPDHFVVFARLGRLYAAKRDFRPAMENYRMALAGKCDGLRLRVDLAGMYVRQGLFARGAQELWKGLQLLPAEIINQWQRIRARVRQARRRRSRMLAA